MTETIVERTVAAISISTVLENVPMDEFKLSIEPLKDIGASVSHDLGY